MDEKKQSMGKIDIKRCLKKTNRDCRSTKNIIAKLIKLKGCDFLVKQYINSFLIL